MCVCVCACIGRLAREFQYNWHDRWAIALGIRHYQPFFHKPLQQPQEQLKYYYIDFSIAHSLPRSQQMQTNTHGEKTGKYSNKKCFKFQICIQSRLSSLSLALSLSIIIIRNSPFGVKKNVKNRSTKIFEKLARETNTLMHATKQQMRCTRWDMANAFTLFSLDFWNGIFIWRGLFFCCLCCCCH